MKNTILAIDQGTTGTTCLLVAITADGQASVLARGYAEFPQYFPKPGWVEHDLNEIWGSTLQAINEVFAEPNCYLSSVSAIGITNQRETCGVWSTAGEPLAKAIVWQDRRTAEYCDLLAASSDGDWITETTGLVLDPYFSASKLRWLLQNNDLQTKAEAGQLRAGTIDSWLLYKLTGGTCHRTDLTNASRTMLCDIGSGAWHPRLLDIFNIPINILPSIHSCSDTYGITSGVSGLPDGIPICGIAGDQQAALFGQACFSSGMAKCTYGTGAFALVNTGKMRIRSKHNLLTTVAWKLGDETTYALEGSTFVAGAMVQWLRDGLGIIKTSAEVEALAAQVSSSEGVIVVPALTGLGAPHWQPDARGSITGITRGTTAAHIARAALEGIAFQVYDLFDAMEQDWSSIYLSETKQTERNKAITRLRVDGGASVNDILMQFQADILDVVIDRPTILDSTAMGAIYLAALGVGLIDSTETISRNWALGKRYATTQRTAQNINKQGRSASKALSEHLAQWQKAVAKASFYT